MGPKRTQNFRENEDENHADEEARLLSSATDTGVTNNSDSETSSQTSKTDRETGTELDETGVKSIILLLQFPGNEHRDDEAVNSNDTSHNDGHNVCTSVPCQ